MRSQDRKLLEKINGITLDGQGIEIYSTATGRIFGIYKTKERALEVLDEIENILKPIYQVKNEFKKSELTGNYKWETTQEYIPINCKVYEMPEE